MAQHARPSRRALRTRLGSHRRGGMLVLVPLLVVALGVGWFRVPHSGSGCSRQTLRVVVSPELASTVRDAARRQTADGPACQRVTVTAQPADRTLAQLRHPGAAHPDVWLPDSSLWVELALRAGLPLTMESRSVASTPVVLALPERTAGRLGWPHRHLRFDDVLATGAGPRALTLGWPDPDRSAPAVSALLGLQRAAGESRTGRRSLAGLLRASRTGLRPDVATRLGAGSTVLPVAEQALWSHNATSDRQLVAAYPSTTGAALDYPFVILDQDSATTVQAAHLLTRLQDDRGRTFLRARGFRDADGGPGPLLGSVPGIDVTAARAVRPATQDQLVAARGILGTLNRGSRVLAVLDVSGSMTLPVPGTGGRTRWDLTRAAASDGLALFPHDTRVGLWEFSTHLTAHTDYRQLVPIGPLSGGPAGTGAKALQAQLRRLQPLPHGSTGLYDTVLAAVRHVRAGYDPTRTNAVVLLSDGANEDDHGIGLATLLDRLRSEDDPRRPVPVVSIAYGPDSDAAALRAVSDATGGATYVAADPRRLRKVFLDAVGQRLCRPDCRVR